MLRDDGVCVQFQNRNGTVPLEKEESLISKFVGGRGEPGVGGIVTGDGEYTRHARSPATLPPEGRIAINVPTLAAAREGNNKKLGPWGGASSRQIGIGIRPTFPRLMKVTEVAKDTKNQKNVQIGEDISLP